MDKIDLENGMEEDDVQATRAISGAVEAEGLRSMCAHEGKLAVGCLVNARQKLE